MDWSAMDSEGASRGLITMWKKDAFSSLFSFKGENFLGIKVGFKGKYCYFVNVYSSCNIELKRNMWDHLLSLMRKWEDVDWCVAGDVNSIRILEEINGCGGYYRSHEVYEFNDFIEIMELVNLPTGHIQFSWCRRNETSMSRIDINLLSDSFISIVGD